MTTPDKPQWTRHGDTEVAEWRGMRAEIYNSRIDDDVWMEMCSLSCRSDNDDEPLFGYGETVLSIKHGKRYAESLMRLHAERDELREQVYHKPGVTYESMFLGLLQSYSHKEAELSRLRERVEVLEEIVRKKRYPSTDDECNVIHNLETRLAELDKETDE